MNIPHVSDELLFGFVRNEINARQSRTVQEHLSRCNACSSRLDEIRSELAINSSPDSESSEIPEESSDEVSDEVYAELVLPTLHPDYEVLQEIGRGGMGVLYLVRHRITDREEVIKVIDPRWFDNSSVRLRFEREIQNAARLNHANVVRTLSAFQTDGSIGMVMEYAKGRSLLEHVNKEKYLSVADSLDFLMQAAEGLAHAHDCGMVHRDIKPSNMILVQGEKPLLKILDFGLAKSTSELANKTDQTLAGGIYGTPNYMSPEQALNAASADIRSDIYSLGCTYYFMLAGIPPYQGSSSFAILSAHQSGIRKPISTFRNDVPSSVIELLDRMLELDVDLRIQTPREISMVAKKCLDEYVGLVPCEIVEDQDALSNVLLQISGSVPQKNVQVASSSKETWPTTKQWAGKKRQDLPLLIRVLPWVMPGIIIAGLCLWKPVDEWSRLISTFVGRSDSAIEFSEIPFGVEVYFDGAPAKLEREKLGSPFRVLAKPGTYELSFRKENVVLSTQRVDVAANTILKLDVNEIVSNVGALSEIPTIPNLPILETIVETPVVPEQTQQDSLVQAQPTKTEELVKPESVASNGMEKEGIAKLDPSSPSKEVDDGVSSLIVRLIEAIVSSNFDVFDDLSHEVSGQQLSGANGTKIDLMIWYGALLRDYEKAISKGWDACLQTSQLELIRTEENRTTVKIAKVIQLGTDSIKLEIDGVVRNFLRRDLPYSISLALIQLATPKADKALSSKLPLIHSAGMAVSSTANAEDREQAIRKLKESLPTNQIKPLDTLLLLIQTARNPANESSVVQTDPENVSVRPFIPVVDSLPKNYAFEREIMVGNLPVIALQFLPGDFLGVAFRSPDNSSPLDQRPAAIQMWNLQTGKVETLDIAMRNFGNYLVSPNKNLSVAYGPSAYNQAKLVVWSVKTKKTWMTFDEPESNRQRFFFSSDNKSLASVDSRGLFRRWNLQTRKFVMKSALTGGSVSLEQVAVSPKLDFVTSIDQGRVKIWKTKDGSQEGLIGGDSKSVNDSVRFCWFDSEEDVLHCLRVSGAIARYQIPSLVLQSEEKLDLHDIYKVAVSDSGKHVVVQMNDFSATGRVDLAVVDLGLNKVVDKWRDKEVETTTAITYGDQQGRFAIGYSNGLIRCFKQVKEQAIANE